VTPRVRQPLGSGEDATTMTSTLLVFVACFVFWLLLSGHFGPLEISLGALSAAAVAIAGRDLDTLGPLLRRAPSVAAYVPWLLWEIVVANLQVVRIVLHPRLPIDPVVGRFETFLRSDLALTTLANSITLTPGTVTLDLDDRHVVVHSLTGHAAIATCEGPMARRVGRVFGEHPR
jgi:multicomponent Na+:H+ antiporter subunit E